MKHSQSAHTHTQMWIQLTIPLLNLSSHKVREHCVSARDPQLSYLSIIPIPVPESHRVSVVLCHSLACRQALVTQAKPCILLCQVTHSAVWRRLTMHDILFECVYTYSSVCTTASWQMICSRDVDAVAVLNMCAMLYIVLFEVDISQVLSHVL